MASSTAPIIASSSSTMSLPSRDVSHNRLFQFYLESFFKIPTEISHDIIYCQRALKAHIKVHQMVIDVFQQQHDADPEQKKRILEELETEIYEINAEQNFLILRLRRIIDEFTKTLNKNDLPIDADTTNAFVAKQLVPNINDANLIIVPTTVMVRNGEEKLIEKYFEVQKDAKEPEHMEVIDLADDDVADVAEEPVTHRSYSNVRKRGHNTAASSDRESLLKNLHTKEAATQQPSLLKPFNQRIPQDSMALDVNPTSINKPIKTLGDLYKKKKEEKFLHQRISYELTPVEVKDVKPNIIKPLKSLGEFYHQKNEEKEKDIELPVSTNVKMSRLNLRQALKRAQAAVRGPTNVALPIPAQPPPSATVQPMPVSITEVVAKKSYATKTRGAKATVAASATASVTTSTSGSRKSPRISTSSGEGSPERGPTPTHNNLPKEIPETRTKVEEYGQEMFLRMYDLFTAEEKAKMQQRRSKRRRRCVQNINYHYGKIESHPANPSNEPDTKKKRKAFLLSPQVKKALPAKRAKRRSADNVSETNSAGTSRSNSSSPNEKRSCNECLKNGLNLEQCEECKLLFHAKCHREEDDPLIIDDAKKDFNDLKKCPSCKRKYDKAVKEGLLHQENLQRCAEDLELKFAKEKDRQEILERTSKSYKIQMHNLLKVVNSFKTEACNSLSANIVIDPNNIIQLD